MTKKLLCFAILTIMLFTFCACNTENYIVKHNAEMYFYVEKWIYEDYWIKNLTRNSRYFDSEGNYYVITDESAPRNRTYVITDEEAFNEIFIEFPPGIDFEKEMLIIHFHTGQIIGTPETVILFTYKLQELTVTEGDINITFKKTKVQPGYTGTPPTTECLIVKMDIVEYENININFNHV